jgi:hypothetical protein
MKVNRINKRDVLTNNTSDLQENHSWKYTKENYDQLDAFNQEIPKVRTSLD